MFFTRGVKPQYLLIPALTQPTKLTCRSAGNLKHMQQSCENQYNVAMGDEMGKFNWEAFAKVKYPKEEYYW